MKIVIDTNVLVSAAFRDRLPESVILWILARPEWDWIASSRIIEEYKSVLKRPKFSLSVSQLEYWQGLIDESVTPVLESLEIDFPRDRKDAKFLACAIANQADVLLTGDRDFEEAEMYSGIMRISDFNRIVIARYPGLS
jgi:putative PIN family toxin of toxin-antitoxin system